MQLKLRPILLLLVALLCPLIAGAAAPSFADHSVGNTAEPDRRALEVSLDGSTWTESITTPLFDPLVRWVPGDTRTAGFFVRNNRVDAGDLRVVLERPSSGVLLGTGFLAIAARAGDGAWVEIQSGGRHELINAADVAPGAELSVELRATMDEDAPNGTMILGTDLDLSLTLTQDGVVDDASSEDDRGPTAVNGAEGQFDPSGQNGAGSPGDLANPGAIDAGVLPDTGTVLRPWVLPLALLLLGAGAVLVARRTEDEHAPEAAHLDATLRLRPPKP